ncbi:GtrA family protein [Desulforhabdus amnigena]|jgi:putative flippase GtrA|uniref:GtrA family protein n=1 Tax=Desulforhabdus amnigena TaxID=40218 RepID=UPI0024905461|nr:GtrA family protein [Desulforhabdus amnigena]
MFKQFSLYLIVAGSAALLNFGSRFLYNAFVPFEISVVLAYTTGLIYNYMLSRRFVFEGACSVGKRKQLPVFTVVAMLGLTLTWLGSMEALSVLNSFGPLEERKSQEALAHIAGIGFGFIGNYIGHKYITFRR